MTTILLTTLPKDVFEIILKMLDTKACDNVKSVCWRLYRLRKRYVSSVIFEQKDHSTPIKISEMSRCIGHYYKINSLEFRDGVYPSVACIEVLKRPKWLKSLSLRVPVNSSFLKLVSSRCKNITKIELDHGYFDDEMVAYVLGLQKLEHLEVDCSKVNDEGFIGIGKLKNLRTVTVKECSNLTDNFIRKISCIKGLQELSISKAPKISSAAFVTLRHIKSLKYICLEGVDSVNENSVQDLQDFLGRGVQIDVLKGGGSFWGGMLSSFVKFQGGGLGGVGV